jgi:hypothetical protein
MFICKYPKQTLTLQAAFPGIAFWASYFTSAKWYYQPVMAI